MPLPGVFVGQNSFNRRGDSLGGATGVILALLCLVLPVSIAEAILWGEQPVPAYAPPSEPFGFNRRGDSLGGAT